MSKKLSEMTLEELWQLFPIVLSEPRAEWAQWYHDEATELNSALEREIVRIRHIGSTSVRGLIAKPTVDILLEIDPAGDLDAVRNTLKKHGWMVMAQRPAPDLRIDLCKGYTEQGFSEKVFHLHVRFPGDWDEPYFCAYLSTHPGAAREYETLKRRLAVEFRHNRDAYTEAKGKFIRHHTALARLEAQSKV